MSISKFIGLVFNIANKQLERVIDPDDDIELRYIEDTLEDNLYLQRITRKSDRRLTLGDVANIQVLYSSGEI